LQREWHPKRTMLQIESTSKTIPLGSRNQAVSLQTVLNGFHCGTATGVQVFLRRKSVDTKDTSGCPSEMARQEYARGRLDTKAPVYARIVEHLPLCRTCREADFTFRIKGKEDAHSGFLGRLFRR